MGLLLIGDLLVAGRCGPYSLGGMSVAAAIVLGAVIGLALGILISVTTDVPLAPEVGAVLGALVGWLWRRDGGVRLG